MNTTQIYCFFSASVHQLERGVHEWQRRAAPPPPRPPSPPRAEQQRLGRRRRLGQLQHAGKDDSSPLLTRSSHFSDPDILAGHCQDPAQAAARRRRGRQEERVNVQRLQVGVGFIRETL